MDAGHGGGGSLEDLAGFNDAALAVHELHSEDVPSTAVRLIGINLDRLSGLRASGRRIDALQAPA